MSERISIKKALENLNTVIDVDKVYPRENSDKVSIDTLKTIGIHLNKQQALELSAYLTLAILDGWEQIDITAYRKPKQNGKYRLTITSTKSVSEEVET
ncbi:MAG: hypothetical protein ACP6IY_18255 [Promethearchaeia archaeon]